MKCLFIIIFIAIGCTTFKNVSRDEVEKRWSILEDAIDKKWHKENVLNILGVPERKNSDNEDESWFYNSKETGYQEWVISFNLKNESVTSIGFGPTGSMDKKFTLPKILERWKKYNCVNNKSEWYTKGHTVYQDSYYLCDGNRKIEHNRYMEVSWIGVRRE